MADAERPDGSELSEALGPAVKSALLDPACQRLRDWTLIGPVQRAEIESFVERMLAEERERERVSVQRLSSCAPKRLFNSLPPFLSRLLRVLRGCGGGGE